MVGFSMIKLVRRHSHKLDKGLRQDLVGLYKPFRWVPCFMHPLFEGISKQVKKYSVIIELEQERYTYGVSEVSNVARKHIRSQFKHEYPVIGCCSAELTAKALEELLQDPSHIRKLHTDRKVYALLDKAIPSVKADLVHESGITGEGVTIAIIDTGVYPHKDLVGSENRIRAFKDFVNSRTEPYDDNGHGTHCAGDAAGNGVASGGKYKGAAPAARVIGVKVLDKMGSGSLSTVMAGIQWCIDNKDLYGIDIISMSLGSSATVPAADDPLVQIVEKAWDLGIVVCVAAGNEGPDENTISSPGISPKVITVGAMDDRNTADRTDDQVAVFSSRGPTIDGYVKPDVLTPGVNIVSLRSPNSYLDKTEKANRVDSDYFTLSGTSMATPICAGAAALIIQAYPNSTPANVKERLLNGAEDRGLPVIVQGRGYVDALKSVELTLNSNNSQ